MSLWGALGPLLRPLFRRRAALAPAAWRKVAVVKLCCLGDVAFATPLLRALKKGLPQAELTLISGGYSGAAAQRAGADKVELLRDGGLGTLSGFWGLRLRRYDAVLVLHKSAGAALGSLLLGAGERVGMEWRGQGFSFSRSVAFEPGSHEVRRYLQLLEPLGLADDGEATAMALLPGDAEAGQAALTSAGLAGDGPLAVLFPGGGQNPGTVLAAKRWPPQGFRALAARLAAAGWRVAVLYGPDDRADAQAIADGLGDGVAAVGGRGWAATFGVLARADWYCGGDTGVTQFAAALGAPTLSLFGPTDPAQWAPLGPRHRQLWRGLKCSPCFTATEQVTPRFRACLHHDCLAGLGADAVIDAAAAHLSDLGLKAI